MMTKVTYPVLNVLCASIESIKEHGFVSKKEASATSASTASRVQQMLIEEYSCQNEETTQKAIEVISWALEDYNLKGDFGYTIKEMLNKGAVTLAQVAFIVTLPNQKKLSEDRELIKKELEKGTATSEWFGSLRKRDKFFVKLTDKKFVDRYGSYIYNIVTREGNIGSFFSQNNYEVSVGDCFLMKATPKRHVVSSWHGGKETQFNRVVIEEIMGKKEG